MKNIVLAVTVSVTCTFLIDYCSRMLCTEIKGLSFVGIFGAALSFPGNFFFSFPGHGAA